MTTSVRHYFVGTTLTTYEAYIDGLTSGICEYGADLTRAGAAAVACSHLADYVFKKYWKEFGYSSTSRTQQKKYNATLARRESFPVVRDIADAIKHKVLTREDRTIDGIGSLLERWTLTKFEDAHGPYYATGKTVIGVNKDGTGFFVEHALLNGIIEWIDQLLALKIIPQRPHMTLFVRRFWERKSLPAKPEISFVYTAGEKFELRPEFMICDPVTKELRRASGEDFDCDVVVKWKRLESRFNKTGAQPETGEFVLNVKNLNAHDLPAA